MSEADASGPRLRQLLDGLGEGVLVYDVDGPLVDHNARARELLALDEAGVARLSITGDVAGPHPIPPRQGGGEMGMAPRQPVPGRARQLRTTEVVGVRAAPGWLDADGLLCRIDAAPEPAGVLELDGFPAHAQTFEWTLDAPCGGPSSLYPP